MAFTSAEVRRFLVDSFKDEDIETFCFDYFREVQTDFTAGMSKGEKIQRLIEYCQTHGKAADLVTALQQTRPEQFKREFGDTPAPPDLPDAFPEGDEKSLRDETLQSLETAADRFIQDQRQTLRFFIPLAVAMLVAGAAVIAIGLGLAGRLVMVETGGEVRILSTVCGIFFFSLSAIPGRVILDRRASLVSLQAARDLLEAARRDGAAVDFQTLSDVRQMLRDLMRESLRGGHNVLLRS